MAKKPDKPKRRLKNIVIDEISLVDNPAVQDANFVVLSKRIETEPDVPEETQESEILAIAKAMDEDEAYEAATVLRLMAEMTSLGAALKRCKKKLSPELQQAFGDLKSAMFEDGEKVEKADEEEPPVEKNEPENNGEVTKKTSAEQFAEAMELLEKREQERAERADSEALDTVISKVDSVLNGYTERQTALNERLNQLEKAISREQGKDDDD